MDRTQQRPYSMKDPKACALLPSEVPAIMREELSAGVDYIVKLANRDQPLDPLKLQAFRQALTASLCQRYTGHWYPEKPDKGQAYRCIRLCKEQPIEDCLLQACAQSGLDFTQLALPKVMTLWIDPFEVCCRLRDNGPHFSIAKFERKKNIKDPAAATAQADTREYHSDTSSDLVSTSSSEDEATAPVPAPLPRPHYAQAPRMRYHSTPLWVPNMMMAQACSAMFYPDAERLIYSASELPVNYAPYVQGQHYRHRAPKFNSYYVK